MPEPSLPPVVVLCGGLGTRLRAAVPDRPKALAEVGGVPFLDVLLAGLRRQGARHVVLAAGYLGEHLRDYVDAYAATASDLTMRVVEEPAPLGTAGALRYAQHHAGLDAPFLALNGDTLFTGALATLVDDHAAAPSRRATLALVPPPGGDRYGRVRLHADGQVAAFEEKTGAPGGWTNAGAYMLDPDVLAGLAPGDAASLERDVLPALVGRGLGARPYPDATFLDIGTPESLAEATHFLQTHALP